jgi:hypothetical protein
MEANMSNALRDQLAFKDLEVVQLKAEVAAVRHEYEVLSNSYKKVPEADVSDLELMAHKIKDGIHQCKAKQPELEKEENTQHAEILRLWAENRRLKQALKTKKIAMKKESESDREHRRKVEVDHSKYVGDSIGGSIGDSITTL